MGSLAQSMHSGIEATIETPGEKALSCSLRSWLTDLLGRAHPHRKLSNLMRCEDSSQRLESERYTRPWLAKTWPRSGAQAGSGPSGRPPGRDDPGGEMTMRCKGQAAVRTAEIIWAFP